MTRGKAYFTTFCVAVVLWCVLAFFAVMLAGCGGGDTLNAPANAELSMSADRWSFFYSDGVAAHPTPEPIGWSFLFPDHDGVHYLLTDYGQDMSQRVSVEIAGRIDVDPKTIWAFPGLGGECPDPASTGVMIQKRGDVLTAGYGRWWATVRVTMQDGAFSVVVPLTPENWSSVYGERGDSSPDALDGFRNALVNAGNIGLTFGGGCAYGHGVWISAGTAKFTLAEFIVR